MSGSSASGEESSGAAGGGGAAGPLPGEGEYEFVDGADGYSLQTVLMEHSVPTGVTYDDVILLPGA
jgi:hypothetical protein